jgi:response regulator of citrate/malate metabolism
MKTSVFILEDDVEFGKSLETLLACNPLLEVAGIATSLEAARLHVLSHENDIYLVDITLPDGSGIEMIQTPKSWLYQHSAMRSIFSTVFKRAPRGICSSLKCLPTSSKASSI